MLFHKTNLKKPCTREAMNLLTCAASNSDIKMISITLNENALNCTAQQ